MPVRKFEFQYWNDHLLHLGTSRGDLYIMRFEFQNRNDQFPHLQSVQALPNDAMFEFQIRSVRLSEINDMAVKWPR